MPRYEPKWDGYRCLAFRDGPPISIYSKRGTLLNRYFPEVVAGPAKLKAKRFGRWRADGHVERSTRFRQLAHLLLGLYDDAGLLNYIGRCRSPGTEAEIRKKLKPVTGGRMRHGSRFMHWRPDEKPIQCKMEQLTNSLPQLPGESRID
jgi:ATP-dependent DNA ligase